MRRSKKEEARNETLQELCRKYLSMLRPFALIHGIARVIDKLIRDNKRGKCVATEEEVELLSRAVEEERISRGEIPGLLGKSYRQCFEDDEFGKIKKIGSVGTYSLVSALLRKREIDEEGKKNG